MNEEIKKELKSFLSSISPEELKDLVNEYDSEFERGNFYFGSAVNFMFEYPQMDLLTPVFFLFIFEKPINQECFYVKAA